MPIYEYQCDACGQRFEEIQKFSDAPLETCSKCGQGPVRRLLSSPAIQFKGEGWYITDYARKGKTESTETKVGKGETADARTDAKESKSADTKAETPAASTPAKERTEKK